MDIPERLFVVHARLYVSYHNQRGRLRQLQLYWCACLGSCLDHANRTPALLSPGTAVTIFGFRDADAGQFTVRLDNDSVTLNGASSTREATTLFFRTGLNNSVPHTLTITNDNESLLAIGSINVTTASSHS